MFRFLPPPEKLNPDDICRRAAQMRGSGTSWTDIARVLGHDEVLIKSIAFDHPDWDHHYARGRRLAHDEFFAECLHRNRQLLRSEDEKIALKAVEIGLKLQMTAMRHKSGLAIGEEPQPYDDIPDWDSVTRNDYPDSKVRNRKEIVKKLETAEKAKTTPHAPPPRGPIAAAVAAMIVLAVALTWSARSASGSVDPGPLAERADHGKLGTGPLTQAARPEPKSARGVCGRHSGTGRLTRTARQRPESAHGVCGRHSGTGRLTPAARPPGTRYRGKVSAFRVASLPASRSLTDPTLRDLP